MRRPKGTATKPSGLNPHRSVMNALALILAGLAKHPAARVAWADRANKDETNRSKTFHGAYSRLSTQETMKVQSALSPPLKRGMAKPGGEVNLLYAKVLRSTPLLEQPGQTEQRAHYHPLFRLPRPGEGASRRRFVEGVGYAEE
jgi:hypothetical protein